MKRMICSTVLISTALLAGGCSGSESPEEKATAVAPASAETASRAGQVISGQVVETMDAAGYTYVLVDTGNQKIWAAGPQTAVEVGEKIILTDGMPMRDFKSQTLGRSFDVVYFVGSIKASDAGASAAQGSAMLQAMPGHGNPPETAAARTSVDLSNIEKVSGGNTIAELFAAGAKLADQRVSVRGRVVKFNAGIMGRNWIHIQDGSGLEGSNDLTVTTDDTARVGDLVVVRGTLKTDQDFGYGYAYDLMIEQAEVDVE